MTNLFNSDIRVLTVFSLPSPTAYQGVYVMHWVGSKPRRYYWHLRERPPTRISYRQVSKSFSPSGLPLINLSNQTLTLSDPTSLPPFLPTTTTTSSSGCVASNQLSLPHRLWQGPGRRKEGRIKAPAVLRTNWEGTPSDCSKPCHKTNYLH